MLPDFTAFQWTLAVVAAIGIGVSKSGLPGISLLHIVIFANLFPALASTGVVLPMLVAGDIGAVVLFRRHAQWKHVFRTLPPALIGVVIGWGIMRWALHAEIPAAKFNPVIGGIVLVLALVQLGRYFKPGLFAHIPHTRGFAWTIGLVAGIVTMLANAAGPVFALYLLAVALPKDAFVGTAAWFFLLINSIKIPFSAQLGLISFPTLIFNALLVPAIIGGLFLGRTVVARIPQKTFDTLVLAFAAIAAAKLLGVF
jgi:uncharacterized membrane protein YfcA